MPMPMCQKVPMSEKAPMSQPMGKHPMITMMMCDPNLTSNSNLTSNNMMMNDIPMDMNSMSSLTELMEFMSI